MGGNLRAEVLTKISIKLYLHDMREKDESVIFLTGHNARWIATFLAGWGVY